MANKYETLQVSGNTGQNVRQSENFRDFVAIANAKAIGALSSSVTNNNIEDFGIKSINTAIAYLEPTK